MTYLLAPMTLMLLLVSKAFSVPPLYPLPILFLVRKTELKKILSWILFGSLIVTMNYSFFSHTTIKHSLAFIISPIIFIIILNRLKSQTFIEASLKSLFPMFCLCLLVFLALKNESLTVFVSSLNHDISRSFKSSLLLFSFFTIIVATLSQIKSKSMILIIGLIIFLVASSKLLFLSTAFIIFLSIKGINRIYKIYITWAISLLAVIPFLVNEDITKDAFSHLLRDVLNGRSQLYTQFHNTWGIYPSGIGFSSAQVTSYLSSFYPSHEMTSYIHNAHMELICDFGLIIYLLLLMSYCYFALRNQLLLTTFVVFVVLSFGYTIYSPLTATLLAMSMAFDRNSKVPLTSKSFKSDFEN